MIDEIVKNKIIKVCEDNDLIFYDLNYISRSNQNILEVLVDKDGGIDLDNLVVANKLIGELLDELDPIKEEYLLEVASPGAEKPIRDEKEINDNISKYIFVKTFEQSFKGYLTNFENGILFLKINEKNKNRNISINYSDVIDIRLAIKF